MRKAPPRDFRAPAKNNLARKHRRKVRKVRAAKQKGKTK